MSALHRSRYSHASIRFARLELQVLQAKKILSTVDRLEIDFKNAFKQKVRKYVLEMSK